MGHVKMPVSDPYTGPKEDVEFWKRDRYQPYIDIGSVNIYCVV